MGKVKTDARAGQNVRRKIGRREHKVFNTTLNVIPVYLLVINDLFFGSQCKVSNSLFKSK